MSSILMPSSTITLAAAVPSVKPADPLYNVSRLIESARKAEAQHAAITLFPAGCITGATCGDLIFQPSLLQAAGEATAQFIEATQQWSGTFVISTPLIEGQDAGWLTLAISKGRVVARATNGKPLTLLDDIVLMPSATPEIAGHYFRFRQQLTAQSEHEHKAIVWCNCGFGESTTDHVYGGGALIMADGQLLAEAERFAFGEQLITASVDLEALCRAQALSPTPFLPTDQPLDAYFEEVLDIQTNALATRLTHINGRKAILGISGGLDSTLALLVAVRTFDKLGYDRKGIYGITMPGFGTSGRTYHNALALMEHLDITMQEISIREACLQHFSDIGVDASNHDVTYENAQARERTQILMDLANKENAIVIGTGDLSELALGWCTYNGDHMSMYGVNGSIPKTLMQHIVRHMATTCGDDIIRSVLLDIVDTPISPELVPSAQLTSDGASAVIAQKTEDVVGPYELHDFFLYHFFCHHASPRRIFIMARAVFGGEGGRYTDEELKHWLRTFFKRFFGQQFKRSCMPDGPQVTEVSLSPRGAWSMPSDVASTLWLKECDEL